MKMPAYCLQWLILRGTRRVYVASYGLGWEWELLTLRSGKHWLFPLRISHNKDLEDNHKPLSIRLPGTGFSLMRSLTRGDISGLPDTIAEEGIIFPFFLENREHWPHAGRHLGNLGCRTVL